MYKTTFPVTNIFVNIFAGDKGVLNLAPFTSKDFNIRGLADRIKDLNDLVCLYPNKAKDLVFSKYYTPTDGTSASTV